MPVQDHLPSSHSNQYSADSACGHCDGVIRHEPWCITQNASVQYAYQAVSDPCHLSPGDHLILHALGTAWDRVDTKHNSVQAAPLTNGGGGATAGVSPGIRTGSGVLVS
jgi:hypothetical protein